MRTKRIHLRRRVAGAGSVMAVTAGTLLALGAAGASAQSVSAQQEVSQNWSGYVVNSSAGKSFSNVSGSWVQPSVSSSSSSQGYSAFWVGLGGASQTSQSLEQVGTSAQVTNGQTSYSAWYELVPAAQVSLPLTIHAGDHMTGRVTVNGSTVTIYLADQTTGQSVTKTLNMSDPDTSSAEWIAEAPAAELADGSAEVLPLANFGSVTFTGASATAGGQSGSITDPAWTVQQIDMSSQGEAPFAGATGGFTGTALSGGSASGASPGDVSDGGTSFTVSYSSDTASSTGDTGGDGDQGYGYSGYGYPGYGYSGYGYPGYGYSGYGYSGYGYQGYGYLGYAYGSSSIPYGYEQ